MKEELKNTDNCDVKKYRMIDDESLDTLINYYRSSSIHPMDIPYEVRREMWFRAIQEEWGLN